MLRMQDWPFFRTRLHPEVRDKLRILAAETGKSPARLVNETLAERLGVEIDWVAQRGLAPGKQTENK